MTTRRAMILGLGATTLLSACGGAPARIGTQNGPESLEAALMALGPNVDPAEAARAARLAYSVSSDLAREYEIVDPPLVHNAKVNVGLKERGLCYHWARDIQTRMTHARFATLQFNRLVANADNPFLLEHSTAVVYARGADWRTGIVLDPWRTGGTLHWDHVRSDTKYNWKLRADVPVRKRGAGVTLTRADG
ncbi:hypothetical protein [Roseovarius nanhaiticus]|uniref:Lipoprotein n=1 Tax=Roseovarius nanhaiticus TaxID=573024 RepID=A0A1N7FKB1_9RHOB|nr:hypothetical protein [Roseovarius nanhaiticus]SEK52531.1 hypothetical protein SAMN05216208_1017 [Roseovarius nanhaiticus]SIS00763.1 hypothetical protein SAMN05421666_1119 [Roseovarius nanhaiticus]